MNLDETFSAYRNGRLSTQEVLALLRQHKHAAPQRSPLTQGQTGLWWLQKMEPDSTAYHISVCLRLRGPWEAAHLRTALSHTLQEHPALQHVVIEEDGVPFQVMQAAQDLPFEEEDACALDAPALDALLRRLVGRPIPLDRGPLLRVHLLRRSADEQLLMLVVHHIVCDGRSTHLIVDSLTRAYERLARGETPAPVAQAARYADYVAWEQEMLAGPEGEAHRRFWQRQLAQLPSPLRLPTEHPRVAGQGIRGATYSHHLGGELAQRIKPFCVQQQVTPAAFFLAAYQALLHGLSGARDIVVGVASVGRPEQRFHDVVGYFVNVIAVRARHMPEQPFAELLREVQFALIDALEHASYPFPAIVRDLKAARGQGDSPVFQVAYEYQSASVMKMESAAGTEAVSPVSQRSCVPLERAHQEGEYELVLEVFERNGGYRLNFKYDGHLYTDAGMARWGERFIELIAAVLDAPARPAVALPPLPHAVIPAEWNATQADYPRELCVHELIDQRAAAQPDRPAVRFGDATLSYRELTRRSDRLAACLQARGVRTGDLVGLCVQRSLDMVVGLLGIVKAGAAYVPLDPSYPTERLAYMLEDAQARLVLTQQALGGKVAGLSAARPGQVETLMLDAQWDEIERSGVAAPARTVGSQHLAYVMYTSGSTGKPKGVMIPHQALTNFLVAMAGLLQLTQRDRLLALTTYSFDISGLEVYLPLIQGGECVVCDEETPRNAERLMQRLRELRPTFMQATPATWTLLFQSGWRNTERLTALCGGEALPQPLHAHFIDTATTAWNLFGPTETTIWSTAQRLEAGVPITIGRPIANTQIHICDESLGELGVGVPGELCIAGDGLARGYRNRAELTAEKFVENPFTPGTRLYRTGDLAQWRPDGTIEYLGRMDSQVKIRGFRIELGEIEAALCTHPQVGNAVVLAEDAGDAKRLVAWLVRRPGTAPISGAVLREHLRKGLPEHMLPARFEDIEALPLTPNGKVDRKALATYGNGGTVAIEAAPQTAPVVRPEASLVPRVRAIWQGVLGHADFDDAEGFFSVGGDSFMAVKLAARLGKEFGCDFPLTDLFRHPSVGATAQHLATRVQGGVAGGGEPVPPAHMPPPAAVSPPPAAASVEPRVEAPPTLPPAQGAYDGCVAIIGISCQFAGADDHRAFWSSLREGRDGYRWFSREELRAAGVPERLVDDPAYVPVGLGFVGRDLFDAEFFKIAPRDAAMLDPQSRHLLMHSWKAIEDAGYAPGSIPDTSVFMSTSNHFHASAAMLGSAGASDEGYQQWLLAQAGTVSTLVSHKLDLRGASLFLHTNCSSSLVGLHAACRAVAHGDSLHALVGAASIRVAPSYGYRYQEGMNSSKTGRIRAFDAAADGMVSGEGVAAVLLKRADRAIADGDPIYALLRGTAVNNDGADKTSFYAPGVVGQVAAMRKAMAVARVDPLSVSYVEAHGTGTRLGDPIEFSALCEAYRGEERSAPCALGSVKTNIGHTDTVAGLAGCIKVALSLAHGELPPSLNCETPNPVLGLATTRFRVAQSLSPWRAGGEPLRAAVNSLGIGGTNAHAILEQAPVPAPRAPLAGPFIVPVSARSRERLLVALSELAEFLEQASGVVIADVAHTLQVGRVAMPWRAAVVVDSVHGAVQALRALAAGSGHENAWLGQADRETIGGLLDRDDVAVLAGRWMQQGRLHALARGWVQGWSVRWEDLAAGGRRTHLPTYPFALQSQARTAPAAPVLPSVALPAQAALPQPVPLQTTGGNEAEALLTFEEVWADQALPTPGAPLRRVVLFVSGAAQQKAVATAMARLQPGCECVFVSQHRRYEQGDPIYRLPRTEPEAYVKLLANLKQRHGEVDAIVFLWPMEDLACMADFGPLLSLVKALHATRLPCRRLLIGGEVGDAVERCHLESLIGFERSLRFVGMSLTFLFWERAADESPRLAAGVLSDVVGELRAPVAHTVRYSQGQRQVMVLRATQPSSSPTLIERGKTYLITGGMGGIGRALAAHLTAVRGANVVLTGRSPIDDAKRDVIEALEEAGEGGALYVQADVTDEAQMREVLRRAKARFGQVHGVMHSAGLEDGGVVFEKSHAQFAEVLAPKVAGTMLLDEVFAQEPLDFVSYFSTASAVLGDVGGCSYAVANRFQMAYADYRNRQQAAGRLPGKASVINWPFWAEGGMGQVSREGVSMFLKLGGQRALTTEEGVAAFERLLAEPGTQHLLLAGLPSRLRAFVARWGLQDAVPAPKKDAPVAVKALPPLPRKPGLKAWLEALLQDSLRGYLQLQDPSVDVNRLLVDFGFDSVSLAGFAGEIGKRLGVQVAPAQFFAAPTVSRFADHLIAEYANRMVALHEEAQSGQEETAAAAELERAP
jgi:amino acid adenylation domain-containing protein